MTNSTSTKCVALLAAGFFFAQALVVNAQNAGLRFQRPGSARSQQSRANKNFRRPSVQQAVKEAVDGKPIEVEPVVVPEATRFVKTASKQRNVSQVKRDRESLQKTTVAREAKKREPNVIRQAQAVFEEAPARRQSQARRAPRPSNRQAEYNPASPSGLQSAGLQSAGLQLASHSFDTCADGCDCEVGCGVPHSYEPGCGFAEPGCGLAEPSCGCGDVGCGSCVGRPGPDYWCFPVCLPRFKDLSVWGGVQGFRGPRDFIDPSTGNPTRSDSNFGFNEGLNLSGRAPLVGLLFPQLSYQLGYQAVQSRLHGTAAVSDDRSQQFVTAGLFRRVDTGLQAGIAWDLLRDDLDENVDVQQIRYEFSLKSPQGREFGFFGSSGTNTVQVLNTAFEAVDQYALFCRWAFSKGYESRIWGGGTDDGEGLFGAEFFAPLNNRWSVQSRFNYLITDEPNGLAGVSEESWNVGINVVWHLGGTAKRGSRSPYRPLFSVADNGSLFVDQAR